MPLRDKVTFVVSFGDNVQYIYEEMRRKSIPFDVVFLCKGSSYNRFHIYEDVSLVHLVTLNPLEFMKSIYHLATSKYVMVDNYYGFLAVTNFKPEVDCVQLWHASGAIKKFGLEDSSVQFRTKRAKERFLKVYSRFHKVIVGSDSMAQYFMNAFGVKGENILRTGIPRTDFYYNQNEKERIFNQITKQNELLWNKKVILYAPTYRDRELDHFRLELDLDKMYAELSDEYVLVLRLHPAIKNVEDYNEKYPDFVLDYSSSEYDINELLIVTDLLITDYSSILYEYSLLRKPMIFYAYDLEDYQAGRGLWEDYEQHVPGPVVKTTEEIICTIQQNEFNIDEIEEFSRRWNKYSTGRSSENLVTYLFDRKPAFTKRRAL
ncbi:CDP-glycerol glycerophosphotransferase family protein [Pradoshia eiseniae]|nr:CDP-glycerol glycerophosphotransferase family protein [Pradoshia eiseniae]